MPDIAEPPRVLRPGVFTAQTARAAALASVAARKAKAQRAREPEPPAPPPLPTDNYLSQRLVRVRAQLDLIDSRIEEELADPDCDGQRVDRLAAASARLEVQEQKLSGRHAPANAKPETIRSKGKSWSMPEPEPVAKPSALPPSTEEYSI